jgi:hypothetical protein
VSALRSRRHISPFLDATRNRPKTPSRGCGRNHRLAWLYGPARMTEKPSNVAPPNSAPTLSALIGESRGAIQPARLAANARRMTRLRTSDTRPVMVIPGLGTNDVSTWPLRQWLSSKGHRTVGWGLGVNRGDPELVLDACAANVEQLARRARTKVHLIGWS